MPSSDRRPSAEIITDPMVTELIGFHGVSCRKSAPPPAAVKRSYQPGNIPVTCRSTTASAKLDFFAHTQSGAPLRIIDHPLIGRYPDRDDASRDADYFEVLVVSFRFS